MVPTTTQFLALCRREALTWVGRCLLTWSMACITAEPTTTPSAMPATSWTWCAELMPKPTERGLSVAARTRPMKCLRSAGRLDRAPVTPVRLLRFVGAKEQDLNNIRVCTYERACSWREGEQLGAMCAHNSKLCLGAASSVK